MGEEESELEIDVHKVTVKELSRRFHTDTASGLTDTQVEEGLKLHGYNVLTPPPSTPEWIKLLRCFFYNFFAIMLWIGAIFCFVMHSNLDVNDKSTLSIHWDYLNCLYLGILFIIVLVMTSILSYYQKLKSAKSMEKIESPEPQRTRVRRNGKKVIVNASKLTLGDIVEIKYGERCPADMRIIQCEDFKIDTSCLTGESEPKAMGPEFTHENPLETANLAFAPCNVVAGTAVAMVVNVGDKTVMGKVSGLKSVLFSGEAAITKEIRRLNLIVTSAVISLGVIALITAYIINYHYHEVVVLVICIIIINTPVDLMATANVCFNLTAKRMAAKNCLVKNMEVAETLGCTTCICSNKTGTLTQNRTFVKNLWFGNKIVEVDTSEDQSGNSIDKNAVSWKALERVACLCNRAVFEEDQNNISVRNREVIGDVTETAILRYTELMKGDVIAYRARNKKVCEIPFNSSSKFQVSIHETEDRNEKRYLIVVKGAPEKILEMCSTIMVDGTERPLSQDLKTSFENVYMELGGRGETLLGFCDLLLPADQYPQGYSFNSDEENFPLQGLRFVGVMSMDNHIKVAIPSTVSNCRAAGIKIIMVTNDHPITAKAIALSVGIISEGQETVEDIAARIRCNVKDVNPKEAGAAVVHGTDLRDLTDTELDNILTNHREIVFARISPQQKLVIVMACHRVGAIVAITGDTKNDTPALKTADIGVALDMSSTDACKQAADVILLDDNFASLVAGVEEGRLYFDNLKKNFAYTLTSTTPEILLFILFLLVDIPLLLGTATILYIVLATLMVPVYTMARVKQHSEIMTWPPRNPATDKLVNLRLLLFAVIRKVPTVLLTAIVVLTMPSIFMAWFAIRMVLYVFLSLVVEWKTSSKFYTRIVLKEEMSLFPIPGLF